MSTVGKLGVANCTLNPFKEGARQLRSADSIGNRMPRGNTGGVVSSCGLVAIFNDNEFATRAYESREREKGEEYFCKCMSSQSL